MSERAVVGGPLPVERLPLQLDPDPRRVLLRPFLPSLVVKATGSQSQVERLECLMDKIPEDA